MNVKQIANLSKDEPCNHRGCLSHVTHPCEGCGRIAGMTELEIVRRYTGWNDETAEAAIRQWRGHNPEWNASSILPYLKT